MAKTDRPSSIDAHPFQWILIGVPSIDKQHDELVTQLNTLASLPEAFPHTESFSEILSQLGGQISAHFTHEEQVFKSFGMPANEVASHVQAHTDILDQYTRLNLDLMQGKTFSRADILLMIKDWIIDHVMCFDLNIIRYLPKAN